MASDSRKLVQRDPGDRSAKSKYSLPVTLEPRRIVARLLPTFGQGHPKLSYTLYVKLETFKLCNLSESTDFLREVHINQTLNNKDIYK